MDLLAACGSRLVLVAAESRRQHESASRDEQPRTAESAKRSSVESRTRRAVATAEHLGAQVGFSRRPAATASRVRGRDAKRAAKLASTARPSRGLRLRTVDGGLRTVDCGLWTANCGPCPLRTAILPTANCGRGPRTANGELRIGGCGFRSADREPRATNPEPRSAIRDPGASRESRLASYWLRSSLMISWSAAITSSRSTRDLVNRSCRLNALVGAL
jgi:hypothetical protein